MNHKVIKVNEVEIANNKPFVLIAGPCQMESLQHSLDMAGSIKEVTDKLNIGFIFKTSFDKANRTALNSKRGLGFEKSLEVFETVKKTFNIPCLTDVHEKEQCKTIAKIVDIIQIPAFLCRQTDLLIEAAKSGAVVNVKKGQFLAPWDMENVAKKVSESGNDKILLTDRGTCFGYNNLVSDMRGLNIMAKSGYPVVFDATHSVQQPGGLGGASGGQREFVSVLSRAAIAVGVSAVFAETHQDPDNAPSDGPCMLPLKDLSNFLEDLKNIDEVIKK